MKNVFGRLKVTAGQLGVLAVLGATGVAYAGQCLTYTYTQARYSPEFGSWCSSVSPFHCSYCWDDAGGECASNRGACNPVPLNQNPNP